MQLAMRFLGVGNAQAQDLGNSSAVLEMDGQPILLIDAGTLVPAAYLKRYQSLAPEAIYITHTHLDHIGGLEEWFYRLACAAEPQPLVKLFVPTTVIPMLHKRLADDPRHLAEGGVNFWDVFQLIPVQDGFWHCGMRFSTFEAQHHHYQSAYGLALPGSFVYTGDTRPIPDVLNHFAQGEEVIFHDCASQSNPSHTGLDDLERFYTPEQLQRMVLYHFESDQAGQKLVNAGYSIASIDKPISLTMHAENLMFS